ncbi:growth inhibitor PemK [Brevundimonas sp. A19_0]|uniref:growth inhibitor PemK n=1 Tax=Brevundimonas sp. A19_0 TaxID=2821087 RepID=UPI001ADCE822|nr:growth inhibitor PemK [Brevundimonas sp. A19_0]MBO9502960.1 growth inhibitor PemK [Brevundimonas sp. A19_0]
MDRPQPQVGLVIRYDFLWSHERDKGYAAGAKERPCVIVTAIVRGPDGQTDVLVAPITHLVPGDDATAIEIPARVKQHLGLDDHRSFIIAGEANTLSWDDPGIIPAVPGQRWAYGRLPKGLYDALRSAMLDLVKAGKLKSANRKGT